MKSLALHLSALLLASIAQAAAPARPCGLAIHGGAGTYAANGLAAISATGWGEFFNRLGVARDIAAQMECRGTALAAAAEASLAKVAQLGGDGGVIALDARGNIAMPFNTQGMYRGYRLSTGQQAIAMSR